jgi:hypothetical protein
LKILGVSVPIDRAGVYAMTGRVINGLSGLLIAALVTTRLTGAMQGFFFTFLSMATMQIMLDMGMSTVMINFVAHEWSAASSHPDNLSSPAGSRLASLAKFALWWYGIAALVMLVIFQAVGWYLFANAHDAAVWPGPWIMLSFFVSVDLALLAAWTVLEGCNQVTAVYGFRAVRTAMLGIGSCVCILLGAKLWSVGLGYALSLPFAAYVLLRTHRRFLGNLITYKLTDRINWKSDLLPMQWQTWLVAIANYVVVWSAVPITLKLLGPVPAGEFGLTWNILNGISGIAYSVIAVKAPTYGSLVQKGELRELDRLALRVGATSFLVVAAGCTVLCLAVYALNLMHSHYAMRMLPLELVVPLSVALVAAQTVAPQLVYMRAFRREPYPWVQISFSGFILLAILMGGRLFGLSGVAWGYVLAIVFFLVPVTAVSTWRARRIQLAAHKPS